MGKDPPGTFAQGLAAIVEGADGFLVVGALDENGAAQRHGPAEDRDEGDGRLGDGDEPKGHHGENQGDVVVGLVVAGEEIVAVGIQILETDHGIRN